MGAKSLAVGHAVETVDLKENVKIPKSVAFVGRIEKEKGILDLIEIINSTLSAGFTFHVMGDGSLKKLLETSCRNSKAEIIMYGHIGENDVMNVLKNCEFLLSLSQRNPKTNWEELFGINIIQGMSAGCNVVTLPAPGPSEIISDGINGHIVEDAESALRILNNGYDVSLAKAASECVKYNYSYKAVADKWLRVLSNISVKA
nr:glycosyltransferase family 4 protein [Deinococcus sp. 6YEL10]